MSSVRREDDMQQRHCRMYHHFPCSTEDSITPAGAEAVARRERHMWLPRFLLIRAASTWPKCGAGAHRTQHPQTSSQPASPRAAGSVPSKHHLADTQPSIYRTPQPFQSCRSRERGGAASQNEALNDTFHRSRFLQHDVASNRARALAASAVGMCSSSACLARHACTVAYPRPIQ